MIVLRSWKVSTLDVKLGLRMLLRYPGLSLVSVVGMAVAIAIGAGYFGAFGAMLESSLPVPGGDRIVSIRNLDIRGGGDDVNASVRDLVLWREQLTAVEELGAFRPVTHNLRREDGGTEVVTVAAITASGFQLPRVSPILGRALLPEDERPGAQNVLVIGYESWQRLFGGAADVIGETLRLGGTVHTVVGVMPPDFGFPIRDQYWVPLRIDFGDPGAEAASLNVFGRLADGVTMAQARAELEAVGQRMAAEWPRTHADLRPQVLPYTHAFVGVDGPEMQLALRAVQLLVGALLIIVAINVAVLVYARTATRVGEIAVRGALGASRRRIVGQLFVEGAILAGVAAAIGLVLAHVVLGMVSDGLASSADARLPFWIDFGLTPGQVLYVAVLALVASAIVGVAPALKVTGVQMDALKEHAAQGSGLNLGRTWTTLIVLQVAIAVAILPPTLNYAGETLKLGTRDPADAAHGLLRARLVVPEGATAAEELIHRLEAEPDVVGVTYARAFPGAEPWARMESDDGAMWASTNRIAINHFEVFDAPVIAGRGFTAADAADGATAVIVDDVFAERLGGASAVGQRVRYTPREADGEPSQWYEIVGVVPSFAGDITMPNTLDDPAPRIFHALPTVTAVTPALVVRLRTQPAAFGRRLVELAATVDPAMRVERVETVVERWNRDQRAWWLVAIGIAATVGSVLMLSAAGIYAMMSFTVTRRRREIGIRAALGANTARVLAGVFRRAGAQLGAGVLAGLALTVAVEVVSPGLILGGKGAFILPAVIGVILTVGALAALGPARRGLSVEPTEVLRDIL